MTQRFQSRLTRLPGVVELRRDRISDARGYLERMFCIEELLIHGWHGAVAQANRTLTANAGTVRGLHYQCGIHAETKLVTCLAGRVFDVAVDLRDGTETFGRYISCTLDADAGNALLIPEGCAHGFQTLTDDCEMLYFHSRPYAPDHEAGINARDNDIGIDWPLQFSDRSPRDAELPTLEQAKLPGIAQT